MRLISKHEKPYRAPRRSWNFVKPHILQVLNFSMLKCFWGSFADKGQDSSRYSKQFWSLHSERITAIHPPSIEEGSEDIESRRNVALYTRKFILKSQQWLSFCILLYYDTLLQNATGISTKRDSYFITKCYKSLLQDASCFYCKIRPFYYKMRECDNFVSKCNNFYKTWLLLQNTTVQPLLSKF